MRLAKLAEMEVTVSASTQSVQLISLSGLGFMPTLAWATTGPRPRLFALLLPAGYQVIEAGWESSLPALKARQSQVESEGVVELHERLVHRLAGSTVIRNARIFDSERASLGAPSNVLLRAGRIVAVQPAAEVPAADNIIEADGRMLLPGLFDMHSHVLPWEEGALHIAAGVTTMRDMGSDNEVLRQLTEQERAGKVLWPHIVPAGLIEGEGPMSLRRGILISSAAEARRAVDWYAARDYPQIKIYNSFPKDLVRQTAAYAHAKGLRVSGHIPAFMRAEEAVRQGFDEIQHINQVMLNFLASGTTDTRTLERFRLPAEKTVDLDFESRAVRDFIALLAARDTVLDPTLATFEFLHQRNGEMWPVIADIADHLPSSVQRSRRAAEMDIPNDAAAARYRQSFAKMVEFVGRAYRAGVPIVAGTDELAGFTLQRELELYVQAGLTPAQVLQIATWNGAKYAQVLDDRGSITVGKRADLILVEGDPIARISDIRKVALVLKDGNAYYPAEIHGALNTKPFVAAGSIAIRAASSQ